MNLKILLTLFFAIFTFNICYANNYHINKYDSTVRHFQNAVEVQETFYEILKNTKNKNISGLSMVQVNNAIEVYENPNDSITKFEFINSFRHDFSEFTSIFYPNDFGELYDSSFIYLELLGHLSEELPKETLPLLLSLGSGAKGGADAPSYLHRILTNSVINNFDLFFVEFTKLSIGSQNNVAAFLADIETIKRNKKYQKILDLFESKGDRNYYQTFLQAKKIRINRGHQPKPFGHITNQSRRTRLTEAVLKKLSTKAKRYLVAAYHQPL